MSSKQCVVGIGEILMDVFENGEATLGGAPFNVAFHVHQLLNALSLGEAVVLSAVGRDAWGRTIRAQVAAAGMSTGYLANVERQPTGTARNQAECRVGFYRVQRFGVRAFQALRRSRFRQPCATCGTIPAQH